MEYCFLKGFLMVLLIQHCASEGVSTSIQSSTVVSLHDDQALRHEAEPRSAEVVPVVAPPSLQEVQQAVQEASEQVEGRGAEEVLKELLERVVEAARGQAEGGGEARDDEAGEQETPGASKGEREGDTEEAEEGQVLVVKGTGGDAAEEEEGEDANAHEDVAESEEGVPEGEAEAAAESLEVNAADVETGGSVTEEAQVFSGPLDDEVIHEAVEETATALEETAVEEAGADGIEQQVELLEGRGEAGTDAQDEEETPPDGEEAAGSDSELKTEEVSQASPTLGEEEAEVMASSPDNSEVEAVQTVVEGPVGQDEEVNIVGDTGEPEEKDVQDISVVEGGAPEGEKAEDTARTETVEGDESVIEEESVASVNEGLGEQQAGGEQHILETSQSSTEEEQEVLLISAPEPEEPDASIEQSLENQAPTTSLSLGGGDPEENTLGEEFSDGNEIITPTDDLLARDPVAAQPTLDNLVKDVQVEHPEVIGEEPGEAKELVEDTASSPETSELGLEAWKIGAISAAVFLVLETIAILIYIVKCRDKNSTLAAQRTCEEGGVEPEAATGGDCSDDTLHAGNGDTQQIAALDPSDMASTLAQNKEQHEGDQAITMSDLPPGSAEESASTGSGPDPSQDLRTSIL